MIIHLVVFFLISFIFLSFGLISIKAFEHLSKRKLKADYVNTIVLGLVVVATLLRFLYIFLPINSLIFMIIFGVSLLFSILYRDEVVLIIKSFFSIFTSSKIYLLFFLAITFYIGYNSSLAPRHYDVDLYHINLIRWIGSFKIIPGLANLHSRFGFMGSWHALSAFFSFSSISIFMVHALNGWLVWFFSIYCLRGLFFAKKINSLILAKVFFLSFVFLLVLVQHFISSPTTDIPIILLSWMIFIMFLSRDHNVKKGFLTDLNLIILPIFLITIKYSAITLPLISLLILFSKKTPAYLKKIGLGIVAAVIAIQIFTSAITTGHLLYPASRTALRSLVWTLPKSIVIDEREWIKSWAIRSWTHKDIVHSTGGVENTRHWYANLFAFDKKILIVFYLLVFALVIKLLLVEVCRRPLSFVNPIVIKTYVLGLVSWLLLAPNFRFGYGYIAVVIFMMLFTIFNFRSLTFKKNKKFEVVFLFLFGLLVVIGRVSLINRLSKRNLYQKADSIVFPMKYQERKVERVFIDGLEFYIPNKKYEDDQTGYWGFPGTPIIKDGFYLLGQEYTDGFAILER